MLFMDKLYTLSNPKNNTSPKKETLDLILQFAACYKTVSTKNGRVAYIAN